MIESKTLSRDNISAIGTLIDAELKKHVQRKEIMIYDVS